MSDVHALFGAYAVDALDDLERVAFERHLARCADCRAEVAGLREAAGRLAEATARRPPAPPRARVLAGITPVRPLPPEPVAGPARRRRTVRLLVAAAAAVVLAAVGVVAWQQPWAETPSATARVMQADDA